MIKPGHKSTIPLQLVNLNSYPVDIKLDVAICQIVFFPLSTPSSKGYADLPNAKYVGEANGPRESRLYEDHEIQVPGTSNGANEQLDASDKQDGLSNKVQRILNHTVVRGGLAGFAIYTVVEYLSSLINATLGDTFTFLSRVPLTLVLGIIAIIALLFSARSDHQ